MSDRVNSIGARHARHVLQGYGDLDGLTRQAPMMVTHGKGVYVYDDEGKEYIEGAAGMWCASLGFSDAEVIDAACEQMRKMPWYHNLFDKGVPELGLLAEKLKAMAPAPMARAFFSNSGSEANDGMAKLVWYYNNAIGRPKKKKIVARKHGFHGLTAVSGSMTGIPVMHEGFDLPLPGFLHTDIPHFYREGLPGETEAEYSTRLTGNLEALIQREGPDTVGAFIAEPVMGGGGCIVPPTGYFEKIQAVLRRYDILMLADEVITGFGRTGNMFGSETFGIRPDMMTVAKALTSSYLPLSAILVSDKIYEAALAQSRKFGVFAHAQTTTGHPVSVAVALKVLEVMERRDLLGHVRRVSPGFQRHIASFADHPLVGTTRGVGLMGAVELVADKKAKRYFDPEAKVKNRVRVRAQEFGAIVRTSTVGDTLAFSPPLIIRPEEIDELFRCFRRALDEVYIEVKREGLVA
jgi:4-aminobutyrate--pyruvate transaminase